MLFRSIIEKTLAACEEKRIKTIVVGGGVSANSRLRTVLAEESRLRGYELFIPPLSLTLDNAAMIARLGYELYRTGLRSNLQLTADPSLPFGKH